MGEAVKSGTYCVVSSALSIAAAATGDTAFSWVAALFAIYFAFDAVFEAFGGFAANP